MNISLLLILYILSWVKECDVEYQVDPRLKRVVGGTAAEPSQFSFEVAILHKTEGLICGGSIIATRWIVTAAHCFKSYHRVKELYVVAGSISLKLGMKYDILALIVHDDFQFYNMENDIALIRTINNFTFCGAIAPIMLEDTYGEVLDCIALGWGRFSLVDESPNDRLRFINMKTVITATCAQIYLPFAGNVIKENNICAKANINGRGMCSKDSGGALVAKNKLLGILSFGAFGGIYPSVFTRVSSYQYWIYSSIRNFPMNFRNKHRKGGNSENYVTTTNTISIDV